MKDIPGFEGLYAITEDGKVWSHRRKIFIRSYKGRGGYRKINLWKSYVKKTSGAHRWVAKTYIENPENKREVNHKNGIKTDNRVENLEWVSSAENKAHAIKHGFFNQKGELNNASKLKEGDARNIQNLFQYENDVQIAQKFGVTKKTIRRIRNGETWKHLH